MVEAEPSNVTVAQDAHMTDPTMMLTAQEQTVTEYTVLWHHTGTELLNTQFCGITQEQTVTEYTVLQHHIGPNTNV